MVSRLLTSRPVVFAVGNLLYPVGTPTSPHSTAGPLPIRPSTACTVGASR
ncbi:hypothetical protein ACFWIJ_17475 [Streptomyces sp. NPDC127079]